MTDATPPGDEPKRSYNIRDIAALAGVHESTVSRALNPNPRRRVAPATAKRIRELAQTYGYQPDVFAAGLRRGRTQTMGVLVPDLTDTHTAMTIRGVQDKLDEQGVTAILVETLNDRGRLDRAHDFMTSRRVDALIVMSARESDQERLKELARDRPVILCVQGVPGTGIPSVTPDDYLGGVLAAGYLAQLGHKVVAQLSCEIDIVAFRSRRAGFEGRAAELGLTVVDTPHAAQTAGLEEGYKLMSMLLASAPVLPTGVFVHTDTMAIGALKALRATGLRCPEDISVVGFDDNPMSSYVEPPLTTIAFPAYDIGRDAAALALGILDGTALPPYSKIFRPEVVVRQSTGFAQVGPAQDA